MPLPAGGCGTAGEIRPRCDKPDLPGTLDHVRQWPPDVSAGACLNSKTPHGGGVGEKQQPPDDPGYLHDAWWWQELLQPADDQGERRNHCARPTCRQQLRAQARLRRCHRGFRHPGAVARMTGYRAYAPAVTRWWLEFCRRVCHTALVAHHLGSVIIVERVG